MAPSFDPAMLSSFEKDTLISTLLAQVDALMARVAALYQPGKRLTFSNRAKAQKRLDSARSGWVSLILSWY